MFRFFSVLALFLCFCDLVIASPVRTLKCSVNLVVPVGPNRDKMVTTYREAEVVIPFPGSFSSQALPNPALKTPEAKASVVAAIIKACGPKIQDCIGRQQTETSRRLSCRITEVEYEGCKYQIFQEPSHSIQGSLLNGCDKSVGYEAVSEFLGTDDPNYTSAVNHCFRSRATCLKPGGRPLGPGETLTIYDSRGVTEFNGPPVRGTNGTR